MAQEGPVGRKRAGRRQEPEVRGRDWQRQILVEAPLDAVRA